MTKKTKADDPRTARNSADAITVEGAARMLTRVTGKVVAMVTNPPASASGFSNKLCGNPVGKTLLQKAAEITVPGLWQAIGRLIDLFSPKECANDFAAVGCDADRWIPL